MIPKVHAFVKDFLSSPYLNHAHLELKVMPKFNALALIGFAELKEYSPLAPGEDKYAGGRARQIKGFLRSLAEGKEMLIEVRNGPCLRLGKELCHEFSATQKFDAAEVEKEIVEMRAAGFLGAHTYPVFNPAKESAQWVVAGEVVESEADTLLL